MKPLFDCLVNGTSFSENGKTVFIRGERNEQILFFRIDGKFIHSDSKNSDSKKCDLLAIYSDSHYRIISLIELKGKNLSHAIEQFEETINNQRFKHIVDIQNCKSCKNSVNCIKIFLVVHGSGISLDSYLRDYIYRNYGFILKTESLKCDLKKVIEACKAEYIKYEKKFKKRR